MTNKTTIPSTAALLRVTRWLNMRVNCVPALRKDLKSIVDAAFVAKGYTNRVKE